MGGVVEHGNLESHSKKTLIFMANINRVRGEGKTVGGGLRHWGTKGATSPKCV